ncbi:tetratricopeptide repeat protein [Flavobacteriaceae bacterium M23B6Z8]
MRLLSVFSCLCIVASLLSFSLISKSIQLVSQDSLTPAERKAEFYMQELQKRYKEGDNSNYKLYSDSLLTISRKNNLKEMEVKALVNQAIYHKNNHELQKALRLYLEARETSKDLEDNGKVTIITNINLGNFYNEINDYKKSISTFDTTLEMLKGPLNSPYMKAAIYKGLGTAYSGLKDEERSLYYSKQLKKIGTEIKRPDLVVSGLISMGDSYQRLGEYEKTIAITKEALGIDTTANEGNKKGWILLNMGIAYYKLNQLTPAINSLEEGLQFAKDYNNKHLQMYIHEYLGKAYEKNNDFEKSYQAQKEYIAFKENLLKERGKASEFDVKQDVAEISQKLQNEKRQMAKKEKLFYGIGGSLLVITFLIFLWWFRKRKKLALKQPLSPSSSTEVSETKNGKAQYKNSSLTVEDRERMKEQIRSFMMEKKPFLDFEINQSDLAQQLDISSHHLSEVLNVCFGQNFYSFINVYRVNQAKELLQNPEYDHYKMEAIGYEAGFKSKASFNRAFKSQIGVTPSEYRNQFKETTS